MIEKGTYKVVWVTKSTKKIYSRMFGNLREAKEFGKKKKDYLMFRLLSHKSQVEFSWTLLPYGNYKIYTNALNFYKKYKGKLIIEKILRI